MQDVLDLLHDAPRPAPEADVLAELLASPQLVPPPKTINCVQRLRHSHHLLARALAEGKPSIAAAAISGFEVSTVYRLQADPSFQELLAHYKLQVDDIFASIADRLGALGLSFLDELQHRLETAPETFSNTQLRQLAEALLDRSVAPAKGAGRGGAVGGPAAIAVNIRFVEPSKRGETTTLELTAAT